MPSSIPPIRRKCQSIRLFPCHLDTECKFFAFLNFYSCSVSVHISILNLLQIKLKVNKLKNAMNASHIPVTSAFGAKSVSRYTPAYVR